MALQLGLSRLSQQKILGRPALMNPLLDCYTTKRWKSDVGDVIGIDLGTTNSCVSIMVRINLPELILL